MKDALLLIFVHLIGLDFDIGAYIFETESLLFVVRWYNLIFIRREVGGILVCLQK
jgi:hypothetical protein